jgi:hypothetical protein
MRGPASGSAFGREPATVLLCFALLCFALLCLLLSHFLVKATHCLHTTTDKLPRHAYTLNSASDLRCHPLIDGRFSMKGRVGYQDAVPTVTADTSTSDRLSASWVCAPRLVCVSIGLMLLSSLNHRLTNAQAFPCLWFCPHVHCWLLAPGGASGTAEGTIHMLCLSPKT